MKATVLEHLGKLHAHEHLVVYLLAFGPFVLLAFTVWISRRRPHEPEEPDESADDTPARHREGGD